MRKLLLAIGCGLLWVLWWAVPVSAQSDAWPLEIYVIDGEGNPAMVSELGCAYSDGPGYPFEQLWQESCSGCAVYSCTIETPRPGLGAYLQTTLNLNYTTTVPTGAWQLIQGNQTGVLWGDNDEPWTATRYITFVLDVDLDPTPMPTLTPFPTPTPPITSGATITELASGLNIVTFTQYYGVLSSHGVIPDFGIDHEQWLLSGRKWLQFMNQGNLLYVMGGVLLAALVLKWAIDRIKNP